MGITTLGAERRTNPFLAELARCRRRRSARDEPRGTRPRAAPTTCCPKQAATRRRIVEEARRLAEGSGFGQIETPIFEDSDLFARTVGEATDIVRKEMYTFEDRGDRSLTLRPEGTAPVCRAYIEHGMHKLPAAGEALVHGPDVPLRGAAVGPLPPARPGRRSRRSAPTTRRWTRS